MSTRNTLLPCFLLIPSNPFQPLATRLTMPSPGDTPSPSAPFAPKRAKTKTCPWDSHAPRACCARGSRFARRNDGPPSPLRRQRLDPRDLENTWTLKRSRNICLARFMFRVPVRFRGVPRRSTKIHKDVLLLEGVRIRHRIVVLHLKKKKTLLLNLLHIRIKSPHFPRMSQNDRVFQTGRPPKTTQNSGKKGCLLICCGSGTNKAIQDMDNKYHLPMCKCDVQNRSLPAHGCSKNASLVFCSA